MYKLPYTPFSFSTTIVFVALAVAPVCFVTVHFIICVPTAKVFVFVTFASPLLVSVYTTLAIPVVPFAVYVKYLLISLLSPSVIVSAPSDTTVTVGGFLSMLFMVNVAVVISSVLFFTLAFTVQLLVTSNVLVSPVTVCHVAPPFVLISFIPLLALLGHITVTVTLFLVGVLGFADICIVPSNMLFISTVLLAVFPLLFSTVNV